jgi:hypothetical protein
MTAPNKLDYDQIRAMAMAIGIDLPDHRLTQLTRTFNEFLEAFAPIWELELDEQEPPVMTFSSEMDES